MSCLKTKAGAQPTPPGGMDRTILVVVGRMEVIVMSASENSNMRKYQSFMLRV